MQREVHLRFARRLPAGSAGIAVPKLNTRLHSLPTFRRCRSCQFNRQSATPAVEERTSPARDFLRTCLRRAEGWNRRRDARALRRSCNQGFRRAVRRARQLACRSASRVWAKRWMARYSRRHSAHGKRAESGRHAWGTTLNVFHCRRQVKKARPDERAFASSTSRISFVFHSRSFRFSLRTRRSARLRSTLLLWPRWTKTWPTTMPLAELLRQTSCRSVSDGKHPARS